MRLERGGALQSLGVRAEAGFAAPIEQGRASRLMEHRGAGADAQVPINRLGAVDRFAAYSVRRYYLSDLFVDRCAAIKRTEHDRFNVLVTTFDYDWYLHDA